MQQLIKADHAYAFSDVRDMYLEASKAVFTTISESNEEKKNKIWDCIKIFSEKQLFN